MKRFVLLLGVFCVAALGVSQEKQEKMPIRKTPGLSAEGQVMLWHGYIVDAMCAKNMAKKSEVMARASKHTKECALEEACASSGYGLFYEDGKWAKFDDKGNKEAKAAIENSKREKELMFEVKGTMQGQTLAVVSLKEASKTPGHPEGKKADTRKTVPAPK